MKMTGPRKVPDIPIINQSRQSDVGDKHPYRTLPPFPVVDMNHALSHADTNCPLSFNRVPTLRFSPPIMEIMLMMQMLRLEKLVMNKLMIMMMTILMVMLTTMMIIMILILIMILARIRGGGGYDDDGDDDDDDDVA